MKKLLLATAAVLVLTSAAKADLYANFNMVCSPKPLPQSKADTDPVIGVLVNIDAVDDGSMVKWHFRVVHKTYSGRTFSRWDQYHNIKVYHEAPDQYWSELWNWLGVSNKGNKLLMHGIFGRLTNDQLWYNEWVINPTTGQDELVTQASCEPINNQSQQRPLEDGCPVGVDCSK
jgi:hypothetical protein